jgi:hypothetical protein
MKNRRSVIPVTIIATLMLVGCRATVPVQNVVKASYGSASYANAGKLTLNDYEKAINRAGTYRKWVSKPVVPGHIEATNVIRTKHTVAVDIFFNTETFSIDYKRSTNLKWNPTSRTIHPHYNSWVKLLEADIKAEIQRMRAR